MLQATELLSSTLSMISNGKTGYMRRTLWIFLLGTAQILPYCQFVAAQNAGISTSSRVSLISPRDVPSEKVQIDYFMTGPFGGYGGFVRPEKQRRGYEIEASVEGRPADELKVIAYLP